MRVNFPVLIVLIGFVPGCAMHTPLRQPVVQKPGKIVYVHQQQAIPFTRKTRENETRQFLALINHYRNQHKLRPLVLDAKLQKAAQWMSEDMAKNDYHNHRDSLKRDPLRRLRDFGYTYNTYTAENVAAGQSTAAEVLAAWQKSPGHNANMLESHLKVIGIGLSYNKDSKFGWFWATNFGGQKSDSESGGF